MPKTKISEYSTTNSDNTDIESINIAEGCAPSGINNAIRELMVHLKEFQTGASGDAFTFAGGVLISGTANTITGNVLMSGTNTITGSTTATFAAGAVGTPSIAAHGDTNTGIFFPAADTIAFAEGGAEAMRINSSGQVGIGTSSPTDRLHVVSSSRNVATIESTDAGALNGPYLNLFRNSASPAANDYLGFLQFSGKNSTAVTVDYAWIGAQATQVTTSPAHNGDLVFSTALLGAMTERMRLDSSGNVGIGTTSPSTLLHLSGAGPNIRLQTSSSAETGLQFYSGTDSRGKLFWAGTGATGFEAGVAGNGYYYTIALNGSERMRIDSSGNVGIGTTSPGRKLQITDTSQNPLMTLVGASGNEGGYLFGDNASDASGQIRYNHTSDYMYFATAGSERARITSGGYFKASNTGSYVGSAGNYHEFLASTDNQNVIWIKSNASNGTQYGPYIQTANDQNDATRYFLQCAGNTTERATIRSNGGLANYSANNVNLASDERLKKDISPLATTWNKVKALEVVNFRYKDCNEGDPLLYGVIAQQVQPIVPELVVVTQEAKEATEDKEATPEYFGIREQPMYWLAIKALQEAMTRIEALETEVAAMKAK